MAIAIPWLEEVVADGATAGFERGEGTFFLEVHDASDAEEGLHEGDRLAELDVRFSAPVFPGETVRVETWRDGDVVSYRASVPARGALVLNNGRARLR